MSKIFLTKQRELKQPTLILQNKSFENYGKISNYTDFTYKDNMNAPNESSFTVYKYLDASKSNVNPLWDNIVDFKTLYVPELEEKFEIYVSTEETDNTIKNITGTALAEAELSNILLRNIEINTEADMLRKDYDVNFPTLFCRFTDDYDSIDEIVNQYSHIWYGKDKEKYERLTLEEKFEIIRTSCLLHRLLEKAVNYKITHVDESLINLDWIRSFSISGTDIHSELTGEISEQYGVLFKFNSLNRTISVYDMYNTCHECGYRGDFDNECPNLIKETGQLCKSKSFSGQYGKDTTIFVSGDNLATNLTKEGDPSSVKTCFYVEGGDDLMTAAVAASSPTGTNYLYIISPELKADMPVELSESIDKYNDKVNELSSREFEIDLTQYNNIRTYFNDKPTDSDYIEHIGKEPNHYYEEVIYPEYTSPIIGYSKTTELMYNIMDMQSVLQTSMMPTMKTETPTIEETMAIIEDLQKENVSVQVVSTANGTHSTIDNAVLGLVKASINTAMYKPEITISSYVYNEVGTWIGKVKITELEVEESEKAKSMESDELTFIVNDDVVNFTFQKTKKNMARLDLSEVLDMTNIGNITSSKEERDKLFNVFKAKLNYYSKDYLIDLLSAYDGCTSVWDGMKTAMTDNFQDYELFRSEYSRRQEEIEKMISLRDAQINALGAIYKIDNKDFKESGPLYEMRKAVQEEMDFEKFLGEHWPAFCSYIKEDTYKNENYISDGMNNQELVNAATELYNIAKRDLDKSSRNQYTINTSLNNLMIIPGFEPLLNYFETGNWIRVKLDDDIYRLRLLSYQINYDNPESLTVEFSTVLFGLGASDVKSVFESAANIAGNFATISNQMGKVTEMTSYVDKWVREGLDATATTFVNDSLTQEIIIDTNGILGRAYDDILGDYDTHQFKMNRNGLYLTNDSWESITTAIGKYYYEDENGVLQIAYGVLAEVLIGQLIMGETLLIRNTSGKLRFSNDGLEIEGVISPVKVAINPNAERVFRITNTTDNKDVIYMDENGKAIFTGDIYADNGKFTGEINATSGTFSGALFGATGSFSGSVVATTLTATNAGQIGPWNFNNTSIYRINSTYGASNGIYFGTNGLSITDKFKVSSSGGLYATGADISGKITATSGSISGSLLVGTINCNLLSGGIINGQTINGGTINGTALTGVTGDFSGTVTATRLYADGGVIDFGSASIRGGYESVGNNPYLINVAQSAASGNNGTIDVDLDDSYSGTKWNVTYFGWNKKAAEGNAGRYYRFTALRGCNLKIYTFKATRGGTTEYGGNIHIDSDNNFRIDYNGTFYLDGNEFDPSQQASDNRVKTLAKLNTKYEEFYMNLKAISYVLKDGGERSHLGFEAQQVEQSLLKAGLSTKDFAGLIKAANYTYRTPANEKILYDEFYLLRYQEFISLNTHMIQKNIRMIESQKMKINELEKKLNYALLQIQQLKEAIV